MKTEPTETLLNFLIELGSTRHGYGAKTGIRAEEHLSDNKIRINAGNPAAPELPVYGDIEFKDNVVKVNLIPGNRTSEITLLGDKFQFKNSDNGVETVENVASSDPKMNELIYLTRRENINAFPEFAANPYLSTEYRLLISPPRKERQFNEAMNILSDSEPNKQKLADLNVALQPLNLKLMAFVYDNKAHFDNFVYVSENKWTDSYAKEELNSETVFNDIVSAEAGYMMNKFAPWRGETDLIKNPDLLQAYNKRYDILKSAMSSLEPAEFEKFNAVCETLSKKNGAFLIANEHMVGVRFVNHENSHNGTHYENNNSYDTLYIKDGKLKRKIELKVRGISRLPQEADVAEFCSAVEKGERPTQSLASPDLSSMPVFNIPKLGI